MLKDEYKSAPTHQILKVMLSPLLVQSHVLSRWPQQHIVLSGLHPQTKLTLWEWWAAPTFQVQERGEESLIVQVQF